MFSFGGATKLVGNHLVGGELTYECLGGNQYQVNLIIYRDCYTNGAPFDAVTAIYLRDPNTGTYLPNPLDPTVFRIPIALNPLDTLQVPINDEELCTDDIPDVCVSRAEYNVNLNLAPRAGGYEVVHQRCCRNTTIVNIISPGETGSTYSLLIPHEDNTCDNDSPVFTNFPPIVICDGYPILFDHSATDADGDSLVYSLCLPSDGALPDCPGNPLFEENTNIYAGPNFCAGNTFEEVLLAIPFPVGSVNWLPGFSTNDQLGNPADPLSIDPVTGILTGTPNGVGQYVVGICVSEYRNGVLLGTRVRDFQFNVTTCDIIRAIPGLEAIELSPGVFQLTNCDEFLINFPNTSVNALGYFWDFGVEGTDTDISILEFPTFLYPDTGRYEIQLIASNGPACLDTATLILDLYPGFDTEFLFETGQCTNNSFEFTDVTQSTYGNVDSWTWDFGDGTVFGPGNGTISGPMTSGSFTNPLHFYEEPGLYNVILTSTNDLGCSDVAQYTIEVLQHPETSIEFDFLCLDLPTIFTGSTDIPVVSYNWLFDNILPDTGPTSLQLYNTPGNYSTSLITETSEGCMDTALLEFEIYPTIFADAGLPQEMCFGDVIVLDASNTTGGAGVNLNSYEWTPAEFLIDNIDSAMPGVSPIVDQTFNVTVSDPNGCSDDAQVFITVHPLPDVNAGLDIPDVCLGADTNQLVGNVDTTVIDFEWTPANVLSDATILDPFILATDTTDFVLSAIDNNNCENTDTVEVTVIPPVNPMVGIADSTICEGDTIQLSASGGAEFSWDPDFALSDADIANPFANPDEDIVYTVTVANPPCFYGSLDVDINVNPAPFVDAGPDATINIGETTQLSGMGEVTYLWTPEDGLSETDIADPTAMPLGTTTYVLTTESDLGCKASDETLITVTKFFDVILPNAFSPNGDGFNDFIGVRARGIEELEQFLIYNRWGQLVFETNDINARWDGTFKGKPQDIGVYVFYVQAQKFLGGEYFIKGNITLLR